MQPDRSQSSAQVRTQGRAASFDAGLQAHMQRIYNRMTMGVLITALTAWLVSSSPFLLTLFMGGPQAWLVMLAPVAIIWFGFNPMTMSAQKLKLSFFAISILYGISFAVIFLAFTGADIARAFFVAAGMFAGLSVFGYTTKKNLDALGHFAIMGVFGIFFASIAYMIAGAFGYANSGIENVIAGLGILAFSGITAWQTQSMKEMYNPAHGDEGNSRMGWSAALTLYISFIALFQYILHFMSQR